MRTRWRLGLNEVVGLRGLASAATVVAAVLGLAVLLPLMQATFQNAWAVSRDGAGFVTLPSMWMWPAGARFGEAHFVGLFRVCLASAWLAWALLGVSAASDAAPDVRAIWMVGGLGVTLTVVAFPPILSGDALANVAHGRLHGLHGLNPYLAGRPALAALHDPSASFLLWDMPLPYGPLWALVAAFISSWGLGIHAELLAHKAWAGLGLIAAAAVGGRLATLRGAPCAGWVPLLIALNPLLLIEGPGTGHNDIVMVALLLLGALKSARHQSFGAAIAVGLAVAIKPVAVLAVPLVLTAYARCPGVSNARRAITMLALMAMPTLMLSLYFGGPELLARAVAVRMEIPHAQGPLVIGGALSVAGAYALWRLRRAVETRPAAWLDAWVPIALAVGVVAAPLNFPWYLTWAVAPALTLPGKHGLGAIVVTTVVSVALMWRYTVPI